MRFRSVMRACSRLRHAKKVAAVAALATPILVQQENVSSFDYKNFIAGLRKKYSTPTPADKHLQNTAVLVRSYSPTPAMVDRVIDWALDLKSKNVPLHVSVDITKSGDENEVANKFRKRLSERKLDVGLIHFHTYTDFDIDETFPHVVELRKMADDKCFRFLRRMSLAWGFHAECISLWRRDVKCDADFVWLLEDDVGTTASILDILKTYANNNSDLIAGKQWNKMCPQLPPIGVMPNRPLNFGLRDPSFPDDHKPWTWWAVSTPLWLKHIKERKSCVEHVERYSKRFLDVMDEWLENELSAWSESMMPTLCDEMGLKGELIEPVVREPYSWDRTLAATREEFEIMCAEDGPAKFVHPLKF